MLVTSRFHLARSSLLATGLGIAHTRCAAEDSRLPALGDLARMLVEALLIHWYVTGRCFARLIGNKRRAARAKPGRRSVQSSSQAVLSIDTPKRED